MKNRNQLKRGKRTGRKRRTPPGASPGMLHLGTDVLKPVIRSFVYDDTSYEEKELSSVAEIKSGLMSNPQRTHWIDVKGFGDANFLGQLAEVFGIHKLQLEDVVNVYQRPKIEDLNDYIFIISRVLEEREGSLRNEQLSIFLGPGFVLTIQEDYEDLLDPVRERIRRGKGLMRTGGPGYLTYALMDTVLDNYFPILEKYGEQLDKLEEELVDNPTVAALNQVLAIKRDLIVLRRAIWSERDKLSEILRNNYGLFPEHIRIYIRDTYDHAIQILDLVESNKELTGSMLDIYHSSVSNRLNQVIKILTIISTIFIPLTFIVGVYGMNFARTDPASGKILDLNMPELYSPYGYAGVLIIMLLIVVLQLVFFYRKGWLTRK